MQSRHRNGRDDSLRGNCDRPDGSTGWACAGCFPRKYRPEPEWTVPKWAMNIAQKRAPGEAVSELRRRLLKILSPRPIVGFTNPQRETTYLRAELEYRVQTAEALGKTLKVTSPEFIEPVLYPLKSLLSARAKRSRAANNIHEHMVSNRPSRPKTTAHNYPWEALSIARALFEIYGISWTTHADGTASASVGSWNLSVWPERNGWRWQAEIPERPDYQGAEFTGVRSTMEDAKQWAEYKARHTLLG